MYVCLNIYTNIYIYILQFNGELCLRVRISFLYERKVFAIIGNSQIAFVHNMSYTKALKTTILHPDRTSRNGRNGRKESDIRLRWKGMMFFEYPCRCSELSSAIAVRVLYCIFARKKHFIKIVGFAQSSYLVVRRTVNLPTEFAQCWLGKLRWYTAPFNQFSAGK